MDGWTEHPNARPGDRADDGPPDVPGYVVLERLGAGASGAVWRARRDGDAEDVAVKVVPGGDLAERELALLRAVRHEHVVRLREGVTLPDGSLALVLDLVEGGTLAQLVAARGHLRAGEVVTVLSPLAATLAQLHARGIEHGDLAPGNVLLDPAGRPLLADLGTVRITGERRQEQFGTPGYVDPAVLAGGTAGPAADVYGLGALAWLALTGCTPPSALQRPALAEVVTGLPDDLVRVVEEALDPDPARRPDAATFARRCYDAAPPEPVWLVGRTPADGGLTHRIRELARVDDAPEPRHRRRSPWGRAEVRIAVSAAALAVVAVVPMAVVWSPHHGHEQTEEHARTPAVTKPVAATRQRTVAPTPPADRVRDVVQRLTTARGDAFAHADTAALADAVHAGSPADRLTRTEVSRLQRAGLRYRGLQLQVRSAHVVSATASRLVVDVVTDVSGYDVVDGRGTVNRHVQADPATTSRLVLVTTDQGWRVEDVLT